jgi:hypothetical protein
MSKKAAPPTPIPEAQAALAGADLAPTPPAPAPAALPDVPLADLAPTPPAPAPAALPDAPLADLAPTPPAPVPAALPDVPLADLAPTPPAPAPGALPDVLLVDLAPTPPAPVPAALPDAPLAPTPPAPVPAASPDVPLADVRLPTRMARWASRQGLSTLRELARISPEALRGERNLGRRSLADTRAVIEKHLGVPWAVLSAGTAAEVPPATYAAEGDAPPVFPDLALADLDLPTRMAYWVHRKGLTTLRELARFTPAALLAEWNLGRLSIKQTRAVLEPHFGCSWERAAGVRSVASVRREAMALAAQQLAARQEALAGMPLLDAWRSVLEELGERERTVVSARAGLGGHVERLAAIAARLGLPLGTTKSIELRAVAGLRRRRAWLVAARARVEAALSHRGGATPLSTLAEDPWWTGIIALPHALDFLGRRVLEGACHVVSVEDRGYLARCSPGVLDEAWTALRTGAEQVSLPAPLATFRALLEPWEPRVHAALAEVLWERLRAGLLVEDPGGAPQVTGRPTPHEASILAKLLASPVPVRLGGKHWSRVWSRMPGEVLQLGDSVFGLPRHFPSYETWRELLVPAAIRVMERGAPGRQWLAKELRQRVGEELEIPAWLTAWHLGSLLLRSGKLRALGYHRFTLPGGSEGEGRVSIHGELVRLLRARGAPMMRGELVEDLRRRTGASDETIALSLKTLPIIRIERRCYGLVDRDLPGRARAAAKAADHLAGILAERGRGLGAGALPEVLAGLSPAHARWTPAMCLSALRGDARFTQSAAGVVGLSRWESVRLASREELARECLQRGRGRVRLETLKRRIEAVYGETPSQKQIWALAWNIRASVGKGWLSLREVEPDRAG